MTCYAVQPGDQMFVKSDKYLSFARNMGRNVSKIISKHLSSKYSQKLLDHAKKSAANARKITSKKTF